MPLITRLDRSAAPPATTVNFMQRQADTSMAPLACHAIMNLYLHLWQQAWQQQNGAVSLLICVIRWGRPTLQNSLTLSGPKVTRPGPRGLGCTPSTPSLVVGSLHSKSMSTTPPSSMVSGRCRLSICSIRMMDRPMPATSCQEPSLPNIDTRRTFKDRSKLVTP